VTRLLLILLVLPSCAGLTETVSEVLSDPAVQDGLAQTATSAATGNWTGALWGLGGTVAAVCTYKKLKKRPG
jgi:TctA family transporter